MAAKQKIQNHCAHDEMQPLDSLRPHPRNPNKHSKTQIELLAKIIGSQGWRAPIVVSKRSGFIVAGHARREAATLLQLDTVPVSLQAFKNEREEKAHLIADNRIAELATIDTASLKDLILELDTGALDMDLTGYDADALASLMEELDGPPEARVNECPQCGHKF